MGENSVEDENTATVEKLLVSARKVDEEEEEEELCGKRLGDEGDQVPAIIDISSSFLCLCALNYFALPLFLSLSYFHFLFF